MAFGLILGGTGWTLVVVGLRLVDIGWTPVDIDWKPVVAGRNRLHNRLLHNRLLHHRSFYHLLHNRHHRTFYHHLHYNSCPKKLFTLMIKNLCVGIDDNFFGSYEVNNSLFEKPFMRRGHVKKAWHFYF